MSRLRGECVRPVLGFVVGLVVLFAVRTGPARAEGLAVQEVYAEPDLRAEAEVVALLLRSRLAGGSATGTLRGKLQRSGTELVLEVHLVDADGKLVARSGAKARAPYGAFGRLVASCAAKLASKLGVRQDTRADGSLGALRPFAAAARALQSGDAPSAARALRGASQSVAARVSAARAVARAVAARKDLQFEDRVLAAIVGGDARVALELAEAELASDPGSAVAAAARARAEMTRLDFRAAAAALDKVRSRHRLLYLARAELAQRENSARRRNDLLAPLLNRDPYVPALVFVASLPAGAMPKDLERATLRAATELRHEFPGLAASLGLRAARGGIEVRAALDLVEVRELARTEVSDLEPLIDDAVAAGWPVGLRLRAEVRLRMGMVDEAAADVARALEAQPNDARLLRLQARISSQRGDYAASVKAWERVPEATEADRRELSRALREAGSGDRAVAVLGGLDDAGSVEAHLARASRLLADDRAEDAIDVTRRALALSPGDPAVLESLVEAYGAADRRDEAAEARRRLRALLAEQPEENGEAEQSGTKVLSLAEAAEAARDTGVTRSASEVRLAAELPELLEAFPALRDPAVKKVALAQISGSHEPFYKPYQVHPQRLHTGLARALAEPPYQLVTVDASYVVLARPFSQRRLNDVATSTETQAVLLYGVRAEGSKAKITLAVYEAERGAATEYEEVIPGKKSGLVGWNRTFIGILTAVGLALILWLVYLLLRGTGTIHVALKRDTAAEKEAFVLAVKRSSTPPQIRDRRAFAQDLRRAGFRKRRRRASMVSISTKFESIRPGNWWVHLYGTYEKGGELYALSEKLSKQVRVKRGETAQVTFDLVPRTTEYRLTVYDVGGPQPNAEVWLDAQREKRQITGANGTVTLEIPPGRHDIYVVARGVRICKPVEVHDTQLHTVSINVERERRLQEAANGLEIEDYDGPVELERGLPSPESASGSADREAARSDPGRRRSVRIGAEQTVGLASGSAPALAAESGAASSGPAAAPAPNRHNASGLNRYIPEDELGRGAMGVVYRARDQVLERQVALKVMSEQVRSHPRALEMFMQEAKALAALNHPNIVTVFDQGHDQGHAFMVMELVEGTTLEDILAEQGRLELARGLDIGEQICKGLAYAHKRRVIHRDIKPANIFVTRERTVKLGDFGLARVLHEMRIQQTEVRGTPLYMAPEQIRGTDIDFRADVYAVGCTLFEVFTGKPPFFEGEVLYHHLHTPPPKLSDTLPGIPTDLDALIAACVAKEKENRFRSAEALGSALGAVRHAHGII